MFVTRATFLAKAFRSSRASKLPSPIVFPPSKVLEDLLYQHGPQTVADCWKLAEPTGIKSKIRMKALLMWLVGRKRIRQICHYIRETNKKEFLYGPPKKSMKTASEIAADGSVVQEKLE